MMNNPEIKRIAAVFSIASPIKDAILETIRKALGIELRNYNDLRNYLTKYGSRISNFWDDRRIN